MKIVFKLKWQRVCSNNIQLSITIFTIHLLIISCLFVPILMGISDGTGGDEDTGIDTRGRAPYEFTFEFMAAKATIEPGGEGVVEIWLNNTGSSSDTYSLTIQKPAGGWSAFFINGKTELAPVEVSGGGTNYDLVQVYVTAPQSGSLTLRVTCRSQTTQDQITDEIFIEAKYIITVALDTNEKNHHTVFAGKNTTFTLKVTNHQDFSEIVTLSLDNKFVRIQNSPDSFDWSAMFDDDSFTLGKDEIKTVVLTVFAPTQGEPGESINIVVIANVDSTIQDFRSKDLVVEIPYIYNISYNLVLESDLILPNSTVNYTLKLFNVGNVDTIIYLDLLENIDSWKVSFFLNENETLPENINIKVEAYVEFQVQIGVPLDANAGEYVITYGIYRKGHTTTPLNEIKIMTDVSLISGMELDVSKDFSSFIDLGKTTERSVVLHNTGNGKDSLTFSILQISIPANWEITIANIKNTDTEPNLTKEVDFTKPFEIDNIEPLKYLPSNLGNFHSIDLVLISNQKVYLTLSITTPASGKPVTEIVTVYAESVSGTIATTTMDLKFLLQVSDLTIGPLEISPETPAPGDKITVTFDVINNFHLPAKNFEVKLYKIVETDKIELDSQLITELAPGDSKEMIFTYIESEDTVSDYILEAKLKGDIIPSNNTPSRKQNVFIEERKADEDKAGSNLLVIGLVAAIIIALILFLTIYLVFQRKETERAKEQEKVEKKEQRVSKKDLVKEKAKPKQKTKSKESKAGKNRRTRRK